MLPLLLLFGLLVDAAAIEPGARQAASTMKALPGQIMIDPEHPQWLQHHGGKHVFICGPGDPEDFLYLGKRNLDGTRDGDQVARINKLIEHGGNCIYMQTVRTHGGDAKHDKTHNPFVDSDPAKGLDPDILDQWEEWFSLMDQHGILIYLLFYDDGARIWNTGDHAGPEEKVFIEAIVQRFKHHKNLMWIVGEESEERYTSARVQAIAEIIKNADDHGHIIGNHHLSGTTFKAWQQGGALDHFSMQLSKTGDAAHAGAIEALQKAGGRYQVIYSESTATPADPEGMRRHAWSVSMAGVMPMLFGMDIAGTPAESLQQCRYLQQFFEATEFWAMASHDELKHAGTKYVLADPGRSYIVYTDQAAGQLGIKNLPQGSFTVTWLDCRTGVTASAAVTVDKAGDCAFDKPAQIGAETAAWIRRESGTTSLADNSLPPMVNQATPASKAPMESKAAPAANLPPVAKDKKVATAAGQPLDIQLLFEDDDGPGPYSYKIVRAPAHGALAGHDNDRHYTPQAGFVGTDQFTFVVNDGNADSKPATVTIEVGAKNDPA